MLATTIRIEKEEKRQAAALKIAEGKGVYEAGADGFDLSDEPVVDDSEKMTDNSPETRVEVLFIYLTEFS